MARALLLPLLALLCHPSPALGAISVTDATVELEATGNSLGPQLALPKKRSASLNCTLSGEAKLTWAKINGRNSTVLSKGDKYEIANYSTAGSSVSVLTIRDIEQDDITNYECSSDSGKDVGSLRSKPLIQLQVNGEKTFDFAPSVGDSITVVCVALGNPKASVKLLRESDKSVLSNNGTLHLAEIRYPEDRGNLICNATNAVGSNHAILLLRIKSPNAFLPPLIILIVEICVMGCIIAGYEVVMRRRREAAKND